MTDKTTAAAGAATDAAWALFEVRLARSLKELPAQSYLVIELAGTPAAGGASYYVQFARERGALLAEATGDHYLAPALRLGEQQSARLVGLGWEQPEERNPQRRNWHRRWVKPVPYESVAAVAVRTLREVHGAVSPDLLQYDRFRREGTAIPDPQLELPVIPGSSTAQAADEVASATDRRKAAKAVAAAAAARARDARTGIRAALKLIDDVTDVASEGGTVLSFLFDSHPMFVRPLLDGHPYTRVYAPVMDDVEEDVSLLQLLNNLNTRLTTGRVLLSEGTVYVAIEVRGAPPDRWDLQWACEGVSIVAHELTGEIGNARNALAAEAAGGLVN